jgi:hypothetical protein
MDLSFTLNPHQARSISLAATRDLPRANLRNGSIRRQKQLDYRRTAFCLEGITLDRFLGEMKKLRNCDGESLRPGSRLHRRGLSEDSSRHKHGLC